MFFVQDVPPAPPAVDAGAYSAAVQARREGRAAEAVRLYRSVLDREPENTDALVGLGYASLDLGDLSGAEQAFEDALRLAPDYDDARLGLARVEARRGQPGAARRRLRPLLERAAPSPEAVSMAGGLEPEQAAWRLDVAAGRSRLTAGLPDWTEAAAALGRTTEGRTVVGAVQYAERFGREDVYLEAGASRPFGADGRAGVFVGGTPDADFRPQAAVRIEAEQSRGRATVGLTLGASRFVDESVVTAAPRVTWRPWDRLALTAEAVGVTSGDGLEGGLVVQAEAQAASRLVVRARVNDAPETSEGRVLRVRGAGGGFTFDLTPALAVRLDAGREDRGAYKRTDFSLALTRRF